MDAVGVTDFVRQVLEQLRMVMAGKDEALLWVLGAVLAGGHILLEDIPGVGKTTVALAFSRVLDLDYGRMQMTPDVLPSDITGFTMPNGGGVMEYHPGAVMCNLFLADELNRAPARTQSALLEAMEEGQVTVDGITHLIPQPFVVIATQNPQGAAGTQSLPDSQLDRFTVRLSLGYPSPREESAMVLRRQGVPPLEQLRPLLTRRQLLAAKAQIHGTYVSDSVVSYLVSLITATRSDPQLLRGASPRATLSLTAMAKAAARMRGRDYVIPADVAEAVPVTLAHRLILSPEAACQGVTAEAVLHRLLEATPLPQVH